MSIRRTTVLVASVALALTGCSTVGAPEVVAAKGGATRTTVTLRVATDDKAVDAAGAMIRELARQVASRGDGSLVVEPAYGAAGSVAHQWDQANAALVIDGTVEMGLIPARSWDALGVSSLRALTTPYLVTDDGLAVDVGRGDLAPRLMSGLPAIGLTGLALVHESVRHLAGYSSPILAPWDVAGTRVRSGYSHVTGDILRAFGATPTDDRVDPRTQRGMETDLRILLKDRRPMWVTGGEAMFSKDQVLVINSRVLQSLTDEQRRVLTESATAMRDGIDASSPTDASLARSYCSVGSIVALSPEQSRAWKRAAAPVVQALRRDPLTADLIDRIARLKAASPAAVPLASCGPPH